MKKTAEQIKIQVQVLEGLNLKVKSSMFGDDHQGALDAQVRVLKTDMSHGSIHVDCDEHDLSENVREAMVVARDWLDGEEIEDCEDGDLIHFWNGLY